MYNKFEAYLLSVLLCENAENGRGQSGARRCLINKLNEQRELDSIPSDIIAVFLQEDS